MMNELVLVLKRVLRVSATFALLAAAGVIVAYFARIPLTEVPVAVTVPILWIFAISRLLKIILPVGRPPKEIPPPSPTWIVVLVAGFLAAVGTVDLLLSAGTFIYLGLHILAIGTFKLAGFLGFFFVCILIAVMIIAARNVMNQWASRLFAEVWRILLWPARLADSVPHMPKFDH